MPRPNPPPTPGSSSDLRGKEGFSGCVFNLPPAAFPDADRASSTSSTSSKNGSDSSWRPVSPGGPAETSRKKSHAGSVITKEDFTLPPPPTRSRKIIQMKPQEDAAAEAENGPGLSTAATKASASTTGVANGSKRKTATGTTAAGRKIARKTAHSLIERRRRSKMNEEFGVLKDMVPACKGQEMHKLAILQASIDYLRYLEQCVSDLQTQNTTAARTRPPPARAVEDSREDEDQDSDEEMDDDQDTPNKPQPASTSSTPATAGLEQHSSSFISLPSLSQITSNTTASPSIFSTNAGRHYSISSAASQASYSPYIHSNQASPAFGPQLHQIPQYTSTFGLGSPALRPLDSKQLHLRQVAEGTLDLVEKRPSTAANSSVIPEKRRSEHEMDQEATAALLMLNNDRRQWRGVGAGGPHGRDDRTGNGGMSVKDLLSG